MGALFCDAGQNLQKFLRKLRIHYAYLQIHFELAAGDSAATQFDCSNSTALRAVTWVSQNTAKS